MDVSAGYFCPVRGLAGLEPPEPVHLGRAAGLARELGLSSLTLPILEESLIGSGRARVTFLDGLISALDQADEQGVGIVLSPLAGRILGLSWSARDLVRPKSWAQGVRTFVEGKVRVLRPLDWWTDPALIQRRLGSLREAVSALAGHPAVKGWLILDRAWPGGRPSPHQADLVVKSFVAEIRERDEVSPVELGAGWPELLAPELMRGLADSVDGIKIAGPEESGEGDWSIPDLAHELRLAVFLGALGQWLWETDVTVEAGWQGFGRQEPEEIARAGTRLAAQETGGRALAGLGLVSLVDPGPVRALEPPWGLRPGLERLAALDRELEPKVWLEPLLKALEAQKPKSGSDGFIDLAPDEYLADPGAHLKRLWSHFQEAG